MTQDIGASDKATNEEAQAHVVLRSGQQFVADLRHVQANLRHSSRDLHVSTTATFHAHRVRKGTLYNYITLQSSVRRESYQWLVC